MTLEMLHAKLHRATVTCADLEYEGSITIPQDLIDRSGMFAYEKVLVANINNGQRFETYILPGEAGSGQIQVNGAAARHTSVGDRVIIMAFVQADFPPSKAWKPKVVILDEKNHVVQDLEGNYASGC